MAESTDPFRAQTFYVDLSPHFTGYVLKVAGLSYEREVKTVYQANLKGKLVLNQLVGNYVPGTITITKAVTKNMGLWDWRQKVLDMTDITTVRINGSITAYDYANQQAELNWVLKGVWPSRIKGPILNAEADAATEEIELCYEVLEQIVHADASTTTK